LGRAIIPRLHRLRVDRRFQRLWIVPLGLGSIRRFSVHDPSPTISPRFPRRPPSASEAFRHSVTSHHSRFAQPREPNRFTSFGPERRPIVRGSWDPGLIGREAPDSVAILEPLSFHRMTNFQTEDEFDVLVIGAGHAGTEAAVAAARLGARVALVTS